MPTCIDADALKEMLDGTKWYTGISIIQTIDAAPTVEPDGWVAVSERLPEKEGVYLILRVWDFLPPSVCTMAYKHREHGFKDGWQEVADQNITHWMPLPQAPEKGEM